MDTQTANREHLRLLRAGVARWNDWRKRHPNEKPDFRGANLTGLVLREAAMNEADFSAANLTDVDMTSGTFQRANFDDAILTGVQAIDARFNDSSFARTKFMAATLLRATLSNAYLNGANFADADLGRAKMMYALMGSCKMRKTRLDNAHLRGCRIINTDLTDAILARADLSFAQLIESKLVRADLRGCSVYGISVWDVELEGALQSDLLITPTLYPAIRVDNVAVAQFLYLLLNNQNIRHVIDPITSKVVLVLGRFTSERKAVLDGIRDGLRHCQYLPVLIDFVKPSNRDITETVSTLAHMARFVIADLTDPKSIPHELAHIIPLLPSVPFMPVIMRPQAEYSMFEHFFGFKHVLKPFRYRDERHLLESLAAKVIAPAERLAKRIAGKRTRK